MQYCASENYVIMLPVFYECENNPSWRKVYTGTKEECENEFSLFPDFINATAEENKINRKNRFNEYKFLWSINTVKAANEIKNNFNF